MPIPLRRGASLSVALLFALLLSPRGSARSEQQQQQHLAVLEFDNPQGVKLDRTYFSDLARGAVQKRLPQLFVMTRESTEALLQANGKTLTDCTGECEVQVGRQLGADFIVSGRITQIGSRLVVTLRLFSTADARLQGSEEARGKSQDELLDEADKAVARLVERLAQTLQPPPAPTPAPAPAPQNAPPASPGNDTAARAQDDAARRAAETQAELSRRLSGSKDNARAREQALALGAQHAQAAPPPPPPAANAVPAPSAPSWTPFAGTGNYLVEESIGAPGAKPDEQTIREGGTELFNGVSAHYDEIDSTGATGTQTWTRTYFTSSARGVEMLGLRLFIVSTGASSFTTESETDYSPPMLVSPRSSAKGFTWDQTVVSHTRGKSWFGAAPTENDSQAENRIHGEVTGEDPVTIGGKPFRCKVLREAWLTSVQQPGFSSTTQIESTVWFSPALGMVKLENESTSSYQPKDGKPVENKGSYRFSVKEAHYTTPPWFAKGAPKTR